MDKLIAERKKSEMPLVSGGGVAASSLEKVKPSLIRGSDQMIKDVPVKASVAVSGKEVSLRFEQAPATDVVHAILGDLLKVPYSIHQPISGTITLHTQRPMPRDQLLSVLESALRASGLVMMSDSAGVVHVGKPDSFKDSVPPLGKLAALQSGQGLVVVPLKYVGASEMADILKPVTRPDSIVRVDSVRNLLILMGSRQQVEGWLDIVDTFDVDVLKGMSVGLFPLQNVSVKELESALRAILSGTSSVSGAAAPASRAAASPSAAAISPLAPAEVQALPAMGPLGGVVRLMAIDRLNALLVVTPRAHYLETVKEWVEKLDRPRDGETERQLFVYPVQNGTAQHMASLLNALFGGGGQGQAANANSGIAPGLATGALGTQGVGGSSAQAFASAASANTGQQGAVISQVNLGSQVKVVADEFNNSLIIFAPRVDYRKIESALRRLDQAPNQVLIEASILEVTLTDALKYGLQWYFQDSLRSGWSGAGQLTSSSSGTIAVASPGFSYSITNPLGNIRAVLNALAEKSLLKVLSSPSIMVLDNHTAAIQVGDQQPIRSGETVTTGGVITSSIQYKDTGVMLSVTPSVNAGGSVAMTVKQTVTDVGSVDSATGQRSFLQRQISSRVAVRSGETVVLGGLIRDNKTNGRQGVPLLSSIPYLGSLFSTTTESTTRQELLVMITPRVMQSDDDIREVSDEMRQRMRSLRQYGATNIREQAGVGERALAPSIELSAP
ncbi:MAG: type II secretion system secretin GspD [Zoogloea sp.]|uniref:type II secretion system secretin GspD n=1 Tax=Zoogloea sp. TaxID=49181 RepID=UPI0026236223|nr:type II secretion system secretin GspD [Zoogloea sp.]MDD2987859.1 type II secretion system secretin GspD [Zoogloea sp.]